MATKHTLPRILIKGGRVLDTAAGLDKIADVAIAEGKIVAVGEVPNDFHANQTLDATGQIVSRGFVDLCARVGGEGAVAGELRAAAAGGVTTLVCPPDTSPVLDEPGSVEMLLLKVQQEQAASGQPLPRLLPLGALMKRLAGKELSELAHLAEAGCIAFSHADTPLADTQALQRALQYAATFGYTVWLHPRDAHLGASGVAASGTLATRLGLSGVPVAAETIALFTIIELVRSTGCRMHLSRISSAQGVALIRSAKAEGLPITCDVSVNNLLLTDVDLGYFDTHYRLSPVLRGQRDRDALLAALKDGTIDAMVSDHTPVAGDAKLLPFAEAQPGASSVELLLPLALAAGRAAGLDVPHTLACITHRAAHCLQSKHPNTGTTSQSKPLFYAGDWINTEACITVFNPQQTQLIDRQSFVSRSNSSPWLGFELQGKVTATVVDGQIIFRHQ